MNKARFWLAALLLAGATGAARAADPVTLRASLDTAPTHSRNLSISDYLKKVAAASNGRIRTELYDNGQLFPDRDILKALREGQIEMGAPLTFAMTSVVRDANVFELPAFFGRPPEQLQHVIDGPLGRNIAAQFEQKLKVKVLGPWLPDGFQDVFSTRKEITSYADLRGVKLRNAGGLLQFARAEFVGAVPIRVSWPEVPLALSQGMFDAMATTDDSVFAGHMWEAGVAYVFEDHEELVQYVPMVSETFWNRLTPDLQGMMTSLWADNIAAYRKQALDSAAMAVGNLAKAGMKITVPPPEMVADLRKSMMPQQAEWAKKAGISPEMLRLADESFKGDGE